VYGIDYEGHGRSEGVRCYIKKFNNIVNDCYDFFKSVSGMYSKPSSLITLSVH
jgi:acylglycerol lipase